jgi:hypothetical protein
MCGALMVNGNHSVNQSSDGRPLDAATTSGHALHSLMIS